MRKITMVLTFEAPDAWTDEAIADLAYNRLWDANKGVVNIQSLDLEAEVNPPKRTLSQRLKEMEQT